MLFELFFLTSFHGHASFFKARSNYLSFFFCKTSHHRVTQKTNAKRNEINDDDDDDDEIGSGIIRL